VPTAEVSAIMKRGDPDLIQVGSTCMGRISRFNASLETGGAWVKSSPNSYTHAAAIATFNATETINTFFFTCIPDLDWICQS
jgi:hypothetical protein